MIFVEIITNHPEVQIYLGVFCEILRDIFITLRDIIRKLRDISSDIPLQDIFSFIISIRNPKYAFQISYWPFDNTQILNKLFVYPNKKLYLCENVLYGTVVPSLANVEPFILLDLATKMRHLLCDGP